MILKTILTLLLQHLKLSPEFVTVLEPIMEDAVSTGLADATVAAEPIVKELERGTLPSAQKLETAVQQLIAQFKAKGKSLESSIAHLAVEMALRKVRSI